ncbi:amidase [candidate division GN15 bacterium]|uniref:Amidase n=1 Tax=candidate division GN15 bacterium TaxID=2072418 RepID=A0A855X393_9BACT|nr:MAG: amidase [candidate division GN15 bacterium]
MHFTDAERDSMLDALKEYARNYDSLRTINIPNSIPPAIMLNPLPVGFKFQTERRPMQLSEVTGVKRPKKLEDLSYYSVRELGELIRTKQITSTELTKLCIARLKKYDPMLHCVITLTEDSALKWAAEADVEISAGKYRGPLHGIPYGAKDLLAARGYKTTWGSAPYKDQVIDEDATVIKKLRDAGAILVAKTTMGELAWGDVWYGAMTRNPWDTSQGSSGSSAGSASAVSAGLLPFAIGTETWGSIVSPSTRCGTTGLRPTYGRVSRTGAMALSWSMDKIGPICRNVEDCAIVFDAIIGPDGVDQSLYDAPFNYTPSVDLSKLRIGYLKTDFEKDTSNTANNKVTLDKLRQLGFNLIPIELPKYPIDAMSFILSAEAAAAFDDLTRSNRDTLMVRQIKDAWPNVFRSSRFIPAVEYIQANRFRYMMIQDMARLMDSIDVYVSPPFEGNNLLLNNLTENPCVVLPNGFDSTGHPTSVTFVGRLFDEATVLTVAKAYQDGTEWNKRRPKGL